MKRPALPTLLLACSALAAAACNGTERPGDTSGSAEAPASAPSTTASAAEGGDVPLGRFPTPPGVPAPGEDGKVRLSDERWRELLTPEQYHVTREAGTERAGSGEYAHSKTPGVYVCVACGLPLFSSETKFESGTGWPSFYQPIDPGRVEEVDDRSYGMVRTEVRCWRCGAHLGHVFEDGPEPTGLRYCMNSAALKLEPAQ